MRSNAKYILSPSFKKTQAYLVIHVQYTIDTMNIQYQKNTMLSIGIIGYEYLHNYYYNYCLTR